MKKIVNSSLTYLSLVLIIAFLSSCTESKSSNNDDYIVEFPEGINYGKFYKGHRFIMFSGSDSKWMHEPNCELKDFAIILDSLQNSK